VKLLGVLAGKFSKLGDPPHPTQCPQVYIKISWRGQGKVMYRESVVGYVK
jgi:hypothetical protein